MSDSPYTPTSKRLFYAYAAACLNKANTEADLHPDSVLDHIQAVAAGMFAIAEAIDRNTDTCKSPGVPKPKDRMYNAERNAPYVTAKAMGDSNHDCVHLFVHRREGTTEFIMTLDSAERLRASLQQALPATGTAIKE